MGLNSDFDQMVRRGEVLSKHMTTVHFGYPTQPFGPIRPEDMAQRFEDASLTFKVFNLTLPIVSMPSLVEQAYRSTAEPTPHEFGWRIARLDGSSYLDTSVEAIMREAHSGHRFWLGGDLYKLAPMFLTIWLDNEVKRTKLKVDRRDVPELELLRHLRNASAHGNLFYLKGGEPKRTATFKNFTVTSNLHGSEAFFKFMGPGDYLEFLDYLAKSFRQH